MDQAWFFMYSSKPEFRYPIWEDDSKIVGGEEVEPYSIPYQVSIKDDVTGYHFCGGVIYDEARTNV